MIHLIALALAAASPAVVPPPLVQNDELTPGATDPKVTQATIDTTICVKGYAGGKGVRNVPNAEKQAVFDAYGIDRHSGKYEIDHLISLENGGANDQANLWPQAYFTTPWNAFLKDNLENHVHALICAHTITLAEGQADLKDDWRVAFVRILGEPEQ
jgi:hypothetical protein